MAVRDVEGHEVAEPGRGLLLDIGGVVVAAAAQAGLLAVRVPPGGPGPAVDTARDLLGLRPRVP